MATIEHNTDSARCVPTRRKFLGQSVRSVAATAAGIGALPAMAAIELPAGTDPHVAWWRELQEIHHEQDGGRLGDKDLSDRQLELEDLLSTTPPTTREGALAIAAMDRGQSSAAVRGRPAVPSTFIIPRRSPAIRWRAG
jgi:hypothetical protein